MEVKKSKRTRSEEEIIPFNIDRQSISLICNQLETKDLVNLLSTSKSIQQRIGSTIKSIKISEQYDIPYYKKVFRLIPSLQSIDLIGIKMTEEKFGDFINVVKDLNEIQRISVPMERNNSFFNKWKMVYDKIPRCGTYFSTEIFNDTKKSLETIIQSTKVERLIITAKFLNLMKDSKIDFSNHFANLNFLHLRLETTDDEIDDLLLFPSVKRIVITLSNLDERTDDLLSLFNDERFWPWMSELDSFQIYIGEKQSVLPFINRVRKNSNRLKNINIHHDITFEMSPYRILTLNRDSVMGPLGNEYCHALINFIDSELRKEAEKTDVVLDDVKFLAVGPDARGLRDENTINNFLKLLPNLKKFASIDATYSLHSHYPMLKTVEHFQATVSRGGFEAAPITDFLKTGKDALKTAVFSIFTGANRDFVMRDMSQLTALELSIAGDLNMNLMIDNCQQMIEFMFFSDGFIEFLKMSIKNCPNFDVFSFVATFHMELAVFPISLIQKAVPGYSEENIASLSDVNWTEKGGITMNKQKLSTKLLKYSKNLQVFSWNKILSSSDGSRVVCVQTVVDDSQCKRLKHLPDTEWKTFPLKTGKSILSGFPLFLDDDLFEKLITGYSKIDPTTN